MESSVVYQIVVEDVQLVAEEELGKNLSANEVNSIADEIAECTPWYDITADILNSKFVENKNPGKIN